MSDKIKQLKLADTPFEIHPLIARRFSPRAFSDQPIASEMMEELFEAARWAPSAFNEQPWQYAYAHKGSPGFDQLWQCLSSGNQPWTESAAVLMVSMVNTKYVRNGKDNQWARHDLGLANAQLLLQASYRNIYAHLMAGFDPDKVRDLLSLNNDIQPVAMGAFGYLGDPEELDEPFKTREYSKRSRKPQSDFIQKL